MESCQWKQRKTCTPLGSSWWSKGIFKETRKCSCLFSNSGHRSLEQTFSDAKHTTAPVCVRTHTEVSTYSFIYRLPQLLCVRFTFLSMVWCTTCDALLWSLLWLWLQVWSRGPDEAVHQRGLISVLLGRSLCFVLRSAALSLNTICLLQACFAASTLTEHCLKKENKYLKINNYFYFVDEV